MTEHTPFFMALYGICTTLSTLILLICVHRISSTWNDMKHEMRMSAREGQARNNH